MGPTTVRPFSCVKNFTKLFTTIITSIEFGFVWGEIIKSLEMKGIANLEVLSTVSE